MAKSYVKFEVQKEVAAKITEALRLAKQSGTVKKGANEVTKSVERGLASFVVIAEDVEPEEVVVHIPTLCEQRKISYGYLPTKLEVGKAIGINVPCAAVAVEKKGESEHLIKEIVSKLTGKAAPAGEAKAAEAKPAAEKKPKEHKEAAKPEEKKAEAETK